MLPRCSWSLNRAGVESRPLFTEFIGENLMQKNDPVLIRQVDNGFLVEPERQRDLMIAFDEMKVFRSMFELQQFCAEHFNHRAQVLESDRLNLEG